MTQATAGEGVPTVRSVRVHLIRPEDGLGRKRDRAGHNELRRSIERFGVLTPITVREVADGSGEFLLVKGQGRTLACRLLGLETIPAIVIPAHEHYDEKVQHFLVENVARLKMKPAERALLIHHARRNGEETAAIAQRFALTSATVRRLIAQIYDASPHEIAALKQGDVSLAVQQVVHRRISQQDRSAVIDIVRAHPVKARELDILLSALNWERIVQLNDGRPGERIALLGWACSALQDNPAGTMKERLQNLALSFPSDLSTAPHLASVVVQ